MTNAQMIYQIRTEIAKLGVKIGVVPDTWEYNGIIVERYDGGYTDGVLWGDRLYCHVTCDSPVVFKIGSETDLVELYNGLFQQ